MKSFALILALILFVPGLPAQGKKPWTIDRLCGKLDHIQRIPDRKHANNFSERREALRDVSVTLYEPREGEPCCSTANAVIEAAQSGRGGHFEFKTKKPGKFWLKANWNGKDYKLALVYEPSKNSTTLCSDQGIDLDDDGNAEWWATVTVD